MFNIGLIDSLKLRIEKDLIQVVDPNLIQPFIKFYPDNLSFETSLNDAEPLTKIINGITYRYYFKSYPNKERVLKEYLVLQVSAKMLKDQYFEGITKQNYKRILNDINQQYIVKISENVFLNALVSDIDICINSLIDLNSYKTAISLIKQFPKDSCKPLIHFIEKYNSKGKPLNLGVDFNKREKANNTTPYCKIYHKGLELQSKSAEFFNFYFGKSNYNKNSFLTNFVRYEFTIKNYNHKEYLKNKSLLNSELKTFKDLLYMPVQDLTNIAKSGLPHYLEQKKRAKKIEGLRPMDMLIVDYMQQLIHCGKDLDDLKHVLNFIDCKVTKSKLKSKIMELLEYVNKVDNTIVKKLDDNKIVNDYFNSIGLPII